MALSAPRESVRQGMARRLLHEECSPLLALRFFCPCNMPRIPRDKVLHVLAGAALFALGHRFFGPLTGAALCVAVGAAKEVWDRVSGTGSASVADFLATVAGGTLSAMAFLS